MSATFPFQTLELSHALVDCQRCPRLVAWREEVGRVKRRAYIDETYWAKPVPGFGTADARIMVVGLAPGAHGSNRTGRMFTGDASGDFLFPALHRAGFASQPLATDASDGLTLNDLYITSVCHCVPPANKPTGEEIRNCAHWVEQELKALTCLQGIVLLGKIGLDGLLALEPFKEIRKSEIKFGHGVFYELGDGLPWLLCSYHPSRQNTQTGRLTEPMFDEIWTKARSLLV
ncbi:MAG TPA: uracil-DNA glycosylase [Anaerolineaceae bacterium]|nr:uracil-DNA glycosylase [Anaerolineaceae bacterium]